MFVLISEFFSSTKIKEKGFPQTFSIVNPNKPKGEPVAMEIIKNSSGCTTKNHKRTRSTLTGSSTAPCQNTWDCFPTALAGPGYDRSGGERVEDWVNGGVDRQYENRDPHVGLLLGVVEPPQEG